MDKNGLRHFNASYNVTFLETLFFPVMNYNVQMSSCELPLKKKNYVEEFCTDFYLVAWACKLVWGGKMRIFFMFYI